MAKGGRRLIAGQVLFVTVRLSVRLLCVCVVLSCCVVLHRRRRLCCLLFLSFPADKSSFNLIFAKQRFVSEPVVLSSEPAAGAALFNIQYLYTV